jgi:hypothetical protein
MTEYRIFEDEGEYWVGQWDTEDGKPSKMKYYKGLSDESYRSVAEIMSEMTRLNGAWKKPVLHKQEDLWVTS